jgi:septal ring factor EnvC (AmiA/AmiB activator)
MDKPDNAVSDVAEYIAWLEAERGRLLTEQSKLSGALDALSRSVNQLKAENSVLTGRVVDFRKETQDRRRRYIEDTASRVLGPLLIVRQSDSVQSRRAAALVGDAVLLARALADDIDDLFEAEPQRGSDNDEST